MGLVIFVDIDHTICSGPPEGSKNYARALPYETRIEAINDLYNKGHTIVYWTARGCMTGIPWFQETYKQLTEWGCKFHELRMGKPVFDVFIDDKAMNSMEFFNDPAKSLEHMNCLPT
jgi:hypothetical protein